MSKRSIVIDGKVTSIFLEEAFWEELERRAGNRNLEWAQYARELIAESRGAANRSSALKEKLLDLLRAECADLRGSMIQSWWRTESEKHTREFGVQGVRLIVGRHLSCDIQILDSEVSRRHVMLVFDGSQWWVIDLESKNGVYFRNKKVSCQKLRIGDSIKIGASNLKLIRIE